MPERRKKQPTPIRRPAVFTPVTLSRGANLKLHQYEVLRQSLANMAQNADQQFQAEFASVCDILGIDPNAAYIIDYGTRRITLAPEQPEGVNEPLSEEEADDEDTDAS